MERLLAYGDAVEGVIGRHCCVQIDLAKRECDGIACTTTSVVVVRSFVGLYSAGWSSTPLTNGTLGGALIPRRGHLVDRAWGDANRKQVAGHPSVALDANVIGLTE